MKKIEKVFWIEEGRADNIKSGSALFVSNEKGGVYVQKIAVEIFPVEKKITISESEFDEIINSEYPLANWTCSVNKEHPLNVLKQKLFGERND